MSEVELIIDELAREIERRDISQREAARRIGCASSLLGYWLEKSKKPSSSSRAKICELLPGAALDRINKKFGLPEKVSDTVRNRLIKFLHAQKKRIDKSFAETAAGGPTKIFADLRDATEEYKAEHK